MDFKRKAYDEIGKYARSRMAADMKQRQGAIPNSEPLNGGSPAIEPLNGGSPAIEPSIVVPGERRLEVKMGVPIVDSRTEDINIEDLRKAIDAMKPGREARRREIHDEET